MGHFSAVTAVSREVAQFSACQLFLGAAPRSCLRAQGKRLPTEGPLPVEPGDPGNAAHSRLSADFHFGKEPWRRVCLLTYWERSVFFNCLDDLRSSTR